MLFIVLAYALKDRDIPGALSASVLPAHIDATAYQGPSLLEQGEPDRFADLDAKLRALQEKTKAELAKLTADSSASSLLEQGEPDSFADLDAKLNVLLSNMGKVKALRQNAHADVVHAVAGRTASSFLEEGILESFEDLDATFKAHEPDSFADLDAKLKAIHENTKTELAKSLSSLLEQGEPDSFADLDAKLKALQEKTKAEVAKLASDVGSPSSLLQRDDPTDYTDMDIEGLEGEYRKLKAKVRADDSEAERDADPSSFLEGIDFKKLVNDAEVPPPHSWIEAAGYPTDSRAEKAYSDLDQANSMQVRLESLWAQRMHAIDKSITKMRSNLPAKKSALLEQGEPDSFADLDAKLKVLQEKTRAELTKLTADSSASSLLEQGEPDSFADLDAKLKDLQEKTKAEPAKLTADSSASSLLEQGEGAAERVKALRRHV